jgi:alkylation response protein AidB-like acyl-CoA dehydrogenase
MDFGEVDERSDLRTKAQQWANEFIDPAWIIRQRKTGAHHVPELHRLLGEEGWLGASWPSEFGGGRQDPLRARAVLEEIVSRGLGLDGWASTAMVCRTIIAIGEGSTHREIIAGALRGETVISLGYSEPDSGSDAAAAKTTAVKDGDEWVLNGQKMFTSTAEQASHVFLLTRTDPDLPKHDGLTMFLVPLTFTGIEVHPIETLGGLLTNATFYSNVKVSDGHRVGELNGGWTVMRAALVYERSGEVPTGSSPDSARNRELLLQRVVDWAQTTDRDDGVRVIRDPTVKERLVRIAIDNEVSKLLGMRASWAASQETGSGIEGTARKLFGSESVQRAHWELLDIMGSESVLEFGENAPLDGGVSEAFLTGVVGTIRGGSSEVLRDIIAERQLGLPRPRPIIP